MQTSLNDQMNDLFGVDDYNPIYKKRDVQNLEETIPQLKDVAIGATRSLIGGFGDLVSGATDVNTFLADNTYSPMANLIKDNLIEAEKTLGSDGIRKWFQETTGLEYKKDDVFQNAGELLGIPALIMAKPFELASKTINYSKPAFAKFSDELQQKIKTATDSLENTFETATLGKSDDLAFATAKVDNVNVKPVKDVTRTDVTLNVIAPDSKASDEFYELQDKFLSLKGKTPIKSATLSDPSGMTPASEIKKLKDKVSLQNYLQLSLEEKQELYRLTKGIYRGPDGKLRKRVDTRNATMTDLSNNIALNRMDIPEETKLKDLINFQDVFKNFKNREDFIDIENIDIKVLKTDSNSSTTAAYNFQSPETGGEVIYVNNVPDVVKRADGTEIRLSNQEKLDLFRQSVLHELQHAIQRREKFDSGSSVERFLPDNYKENFKKIKDEIDLNNKDYIQNILGLKVTKDARGNLSLNLNGEKELIGVGNPEEITKNFSLIFNRIRTKMINREYDQVINQKEVYTGRDNLGLSIKPETQVMNILERFGVLDSVHFKSHIKDMIGRQQKLKELAKVEKEAVTKYLRSPGEQEAYSVTDYDNLNKMIGIDQMSPKPSILAGEGKEGAKRYYGNIVLDESGVRTSKPLVDVKVGDKNLEQSINLPKFYMGEKGITNNLDSFVKIDDFKNADNALLERFKDNIYSISDKFDDNLKKSNLPIERKNKVEIQFDNKFKAFDKEIARRKKSYSSMYDEVEKYKDTLKGEDADTFTEAFDSAYNNAAETILENPDNIFGEGATLEELQKNMVKGNLIHDQFFFANLYDGLINANAENSASFVADLFKKYQ